MANYEPIPFSKEAIQLSVDSVPAGQVDGEVTINSIDYQLYRDTQGFYTLVNTAQGQRRANENDWVMLEQDVVPAVPAVAGVQATGSFVVTAVAAGDGIVGFNYNGIVYATAPIASQSAADTAQALVDLVNLGGQAIAVLSTATVQLTSINAGVTENIVLVDETTDTTQAGAPSGMSGGIDAIGGTPEIPEQPAVFSVWTDATFVATFQLV
jgi:phage tail sheath gpL-like